MTDRTIDLINRDPNAMNNYIQVEFNDVLAEPEGAHSADCVWQNAYKCFDCGKGCCYKLLTLICGLCVSLYWGCFFGYVAFCSIWIWTPFLRMVSIILHPTKKILGICLGTFIGPYVETIGLIFSRIHVTNSQGPPPKPLGQIDNQN